ncbi:MAG: dTDP-4-dehydrorhamnose 3,5-epimerase [Candidatus Hydrothermales bacterium]
MSFKFIELNTKGLILIKTDVFEDKRGYLFEAFKESEFIKNGINLKFKQDNISFSYKNCLRGLHFQIEPKAQAKLIRCVKGEIFDVAVDLRKNSETFGKWEGVILSEKNKDMLFIPEGFAHGFLVLSDYAIVLYKLSEEYSKEHERGIRWNDPEINIDWPVKNPILSEKDSNLPFLRDLDFNF